MIDRRGVLAGAAGAAATVATMGRAQVFPPAGYGTPLGTFPFPPDVFRERRRRVMAELKTGMAVLYGANLVQSSPTPPFRQDPDFAWLTGVVDEPGAILLLIPADRDLQEILLLPARDAELERWSTERLPTGDEMLRRTGFQRVFRMWNINQLVSGYARNHKQLRFLGPVVGPDAPVPPVLDLYRKIGERIPGISIVDDSWLMPRMRIVKEPREIDQIKRAILATQNGFLTAMREVRPGWTERQLRDVLEAGFRAGGGQGLAYSSIVTTGRTAASLHHTNATATIRPGELIVIDAGASVGGYACDVTRTFPADGRFTPQQRDLYELVLAAQQAVVAKLKAGVYYADLHETAKDIFRRAGRGDQFFHPLGHLVGLNVHDAGDLSKPLPAGAVISIEPGIYVQSENWGIRIEDNYLITPTGSEHLTAGIPRTVAEIEASMAPGRP